MLYIGVFWVLLQVIRLLAAYLSPAAALAGDSVPVRLNVNRASHAELSLLPGIGDRRAADLILTRLRRGPFARVDELLLVPGIGPGTLDSLRPSLRVGVSASEGR